MKLTEAQKAVLFNISHSVIMVLIAVDICTALGREQSSKAELPYFFAIAGLFAGLVFGAFWEKIVEKKWLRMPESGWDWVNMIISGGVGGILANYFEFDNTILWILSIISAAFVVWYFLKMFKTRHEREILSY